MACACRSEGCEALFDQLLALEFSQAEPYGRLHGVTVAAYGVQHPTRFSESVREGQWQLLQVFDEQGIEGVEALQENRRKRNSHRRGRLAEADEELLELDDLPDQVGTATTIADVAGPERDFAPEEHAERVARWVSGLVGADDRVR